MSGFRDPLIHSPGIQTHLDSLFAAHPSFRIRTKPRGSWAAGVSMALAACRGRVSNVRRPVSLHDYQGGVSAGWIPEDTYNGPHSGVEATAGEEPRAREAQLPPHL